MGSVLSTIYQSANNTIEELSDDEFLDAVDLTETKDNMSACLKNKVHLLTDAIESKHLQFHINTSKITYEDVVTIEKKLKFYEKVSLIFLLIEQADYALQSLLIEWSNTKLGSSIDVLSQWARSKHTTSSSWQDRLVEALCIIQNYAVLRDLDFCREDLIAHYLPSQAHTSIHVDLTRKALYCLCEQLSINHTKILLKTLAEDFEKKSFQFQNFENYLELYLLHCFSIKYITNTNMSNLISVLKKSGFKHKAETLESITNANVIQEPLLNSKISTNKAREFDLSERTENYSNPTQITCSQNSVIGDNSIVNQGSSTDVYEMDPENAGICLIINQREFYKGKPKGTDITNLVKYLEMPNHDLKTRHGTDADKEVLSETFGSFGFRIKTFDNVDNDCFIPNIESTMQTFSEKDSCFIVCILSHGVENKIYGADSIPVDIYDIIKTLHDRKYTFLLGKPKVLIIQSCQGTDLQKVLKPTNTFGNTTDGPSNEEFNIIFDSSGIPEKRDLLIGMSTIPGYASIRHESEGSWYIQELCKVINNEYQKEHLNDILTIVNNRVTTKRWEKANCGTVTMVPEARTTLSKKLFFKNLRKTSR